MICQIYSSESDQTQKLFPGPLPRLHLLCPLSVLGVSMASPTTPLSTSHLQYGCKETGQSRAQTKTNFAAMKLFETKKENEFQQTKRGLG